MPTRSLSGLPLRSGATATSADAFTYVAVPEIKSVTPSKGQTNTKVTVVGAGMLGGGSKFC